MLRIFVLMIVSAFIAGCAGTTKEIIVKKQPVAVTVPKEYFIKPGIPSPPEKDKYMTSTDRERTGLLKNYIDDLSATIEKLIVQINKIEETMNATKQRIEQE